ncbi:MAG TPA: hypothetical protein PKD17_16240, partial [Cellvibrionaceae bacterium]|nr:hypothetical protein [Cellvibrionaceae bacterium]
MTYTARLLVAISSLAPLAAVADDNCRGQTPLEISYCTLVARGATGLPALYEFRKNTPDTQYLLLKRPAAKLAVALPAPPQKAKPPAVVTAPAVQPSTIPPSNPTVAQAPGPLPARRKIPSAESTTGCQLANETIRCGNQQFALPVHRCSIGYVV